jgi:hypothetical protein
MEIEHKSADVMLRCGLIEYRNNKCYQYAEKFEEYADGTL